MRDGRTPLVEYKHQNRIPTHYAQAGLLQYHDQLDAPGRTHRNVFQVPLTCGRFYDLGEEGVPVAYAAITLHWSSTFRRLQGLDHDSRLLKRKHNSDSMTGRELVASLNSTHSGAIHL